MQQSEEEALCNRVNTGLRLDRHLVRVKSHNQIGKTSETVPTKLGVLIYAIGVIAEHSTFVIRLKFTKKKFKKYLFF